MSYKMYKYDFGLSFARAEREFAEKLSSELKAKNVEVFYDRDNQPDLWGKDLYQELHKIYKDECRFFIPLVSKDYAEREWPKHELKQAQARDIQSLEEYILPIKFDDTKLPGLNNTISYINSTDKTIEEIVQIFLEKLSISLSISTGNPARDLIYFIRKHNPDAINQIKNKYTDPIIIRVALNRQQELQNILDMIDHELVKGANGLNLLMNGGFSQGHIKSTDPEPHTTFQVIFLKNPFMQNRT